MKTLLLSALLLPSAVGQVPEARVADRSAPVRVAIESRLNKRAFDITVADLATITDLKLPHIHIKSFRDDDFANLPKLRKLHFFSLLHNFGRPEEPIAINGKVFAHLPLLEELIIDDQLGRLPDDVFAGLTSLKVLDLSRAMLNRLPTSMLNLPRIETVYFDGRGLSKEDLAILKNKLGDKLKKSRPKQ